MTFLTPDFSTSDFSTMHFLTQWFKNSWLKSLGLKSLGFKLGVEKSGLEMSFNCFILQSFWANFESYRYKLYNPTDIIPYTLSSAFYLSYCRMTTTLFVLYDISALSKEGFISFSLLILLIWLVTTSMIYSTWVTSKLGGVN